MEEEKKNRLPSRKRGGFSPERGGKKPRTCRGGKKRRLPPGSIRRGERGSQKGKESIFRRNREEKRGFFWGGKKRAL